MITYSKFKIYVIITMLLTIFISIIPAKVLAADTVDSVMSGAEKFVNKGKNFQVDTDELKNSSDFVYNALLGIGLILAVVIGIILGIKYMISSSEDKAEVKQTLVPYLVSCVVLFGGFFIWKMVVNILS